MKTIEILPDQRRRDKRVCGRREVFYREENLPVALTLLLTVDYSWRGYFYHNLARVAKVFYPFLLFLAVSSDDMWSFEGQHPQNRQATVILMIWKPGSVQRWLHHAPEPSLPQARTSVHQPASNISVKLPHTFSTTTKLITLSTTWFYSRRHNIGVRRVSPSLSLADH